VLYTLSTRLVTHRTGGRPEHPVEAVAELATPKQQQFSADIVALEQPQDRTPAAGGSSSARARSTVGAGGIATQPGATTRLILIWRPAFRMRWLREVGDGVRCGQHPALADERAGAVAVKEGDDRRPVGFVDQAVCVGAVVSKDQPSLRSPEDRSHQSRWYDRRLKVVTNGVGVA
jgi:hypothetical protein